MFGMNVIRGVERDPASLAVQEIFYTIQGEGPFTGRPAIFVRLAGCNLACTFCDTEFESGINNRMSIEQIMVEMHKAWVSGRGAAGAPFQKPIVVITGGEPLRQSLEWLIRSCYVARDYIDLVQLETAGVLWDDALRPWVNTVMEDESRSFVHLVCSPKTRTIHPMIVRYCRHYKYILAAGDVAADDGLPNSGTQPGKQTEAHKPWRPWNLGVGDFARGDSTIWVSPCDPADSEAHELNIRAAVASCTKYGYRLNLQIHKIVGVR